MAAEIAREKIESTKQKLFHALQSKYSLKYYLELVYDVIHLELNLCDTSYGFFARVPSPPGEHPDVDSSNGRLYLKYDISQNLELNRHIDRALEISGPYVCRDDLFPYDIVFQPVRINRAMVAYLFSPGRPEGFTDVDLELIDFLAQVLSIELQKNDSFAVESGLKYEYFLQELIDGHFSSDEFAGQRLRQLGRKPQPYYYMLHFSFDDPESIRIARSHYYELLRSAFPDGLVGVVRGRLYLLLPRDAPSPLNSRERQALLKFLTLNRIRCGISYYYTSLVMSHYAAQQAVASVSQPTASEYIYSYEQEFLYHIFSQGMSQDWLQSQIFPDLRLLRAHDQTYHTEFVHTLRTYIQCSRNATNAAVQLHIHKSTFFYRMSKIADLLGTDIYDGRRLFAYEFSFYLIDYLKRGSTPKEGPAGIGPAGSGSVPTNVVKPTD